MIGLVRGRVAQRGEGYVVVDTGGGAGGVGYVVYCSEATMARLPAAGGFATLHTDLVVREDLLQLFGFLSLPEKEWHKLLTSVQGVGAKASLAILGTIGTDALARAIALGDWASVRAAPGVGPKLAQRVVNELKGKAPAMMALAAVPSSQAPPDAGAAGDGEVIEDAPPMPAAAAAPSAQAEALSALANLGYGPTEAASAVAQVAGEGAADVGAIVRAALKKLAPA